MARDLSEASYDVMSIFTSLDSSGQEKHAVVCFSFCAWLRSKAPADICVNSCRFCFFVASCRTGGTPDTSHILIDESSRVLLRQVLVPSLLLTTKLPAAVAG